MLGYFDQNQVSTYIKPACITSFEMILNISASLISFVAVIWSQQKLWNTRVYKIIVLSFKVLIFKKSNILVIIFLLHPQGYYTQF